MENRDRIVKDQSKFFFEQQIVSASAKFNNLKVKLDGDGNQYLSGILDIPDDLGQIAGHFMIEIRHSGGFPYRFPILYEVGGDIPNDIDFHKYSDSSCCITVPADEILKSANKITVNWFIENEVIPYFANQIFRRQTGHYQNEYEHGRTGVKQFYETLMKTSDFNLWMKYVRHVFLNEKINCSRNETCFCGSGDKYKRCHLQIFNKLKLIGSQHIIFDFKKITTS